MAKSDKSCSCRNQKDFRSRLRTVRFMMTVVHIHGTVIGGYDGFGTKEEMANEQGEVIAPLGDGVWISNWPTITAAFFCLIDFAS